MNKDIVAGGKLRKLSLLSATTPERDNRKMIKLEGNSELPEVRQEMRRWCV
jgi:hypothetical protein